MLLLQDFGGAIIAITHNRAFAERLNATHILRVQVSPLPHHVMYLSSVGYHVSFWSSAM